MSVNKRKATKIVFFDLQGIFYFILGFSLGLTQ